jgi:hypothetical protein
MSNLTGEQLQQVLDDLDSALDYVPGDLKVSIRTASDLLVEFQAQITGEAST